MMNGADLYSYLQDKQLELNKALRLAKDRGIDLANAEYAYKKAKAKFIVSARLEKVAVTLIRDLAQGDEYIAELRLRRDTAKVLYLNAQEAINVFKLQCRLVEAQLKREWQDG
jgi:putative component of toxin-antitoxin plasmid stabilization module